MPTPNKSCLSQTDKLIQGNLTYESLTDGYLTLDSQWRFSYVNAVAELFLKRTPEELLGKVIWEEYPHLVGTELETQYLSAVALGAPVSFERRYEPMDKWLFIQAIPDEQGLHIYFRDVTPQKRVETELSRSEKRFRTAVELLADILWTNNAIGEMVGAQPGWEAYTGQTQEQYQGFGWAEAVHAEDAVGTVAAWNAAVEARSVFRYEHRVKSATGDWRLFSVRAVPVLGDDGEISEWVGAHTDITNEREREREHQRLLARERDARLHAEAESQRASSLADELRKQHDALAATNDKLASSNRDLIDATRELQAQQERQTSVTRTLRAVNQASERLLRLPSEEEIVSLAIEALQRAFDVTWCGIWLAEKKGQSLLLRGSSRSSSPLPDRVIVAYDTSKVGWVARFRRPFISNQLRDDLHMDQAWLVESGIVSAAVFPLLTSGSLLGVMSLFSQAPLPDEAAETLAPLTALISVALERTRG